MSDVLEITVEKDENSHGIRLMCLCKDEKKQDIVTYLKQGPHNKENQMMLWCMTCDATIDREVFIKLARSFIN